MAYYDPEAERPLTTQRLRRAAPVIGTLVAGGLVALLMPTATLKTLSLVGTVLVVVWLSLRPSEDDQDYGA